MRIATAKVFRVEVSDQYRDQEVYYVYSVEGLRQALLNSWGECDADILDLICECFTDGKSSWRTGNNRGIVMVEEINVWG